MKQPFPVAEQKTCISLASIVGLEKSLGQPGDLERLSKALLSKLQFIPPRIAASLSSRLAKVTPPRGLRDSGIVLENEPGGELPDKSACWRNLAGLSGNLLVEGLDGKTVELPHIHPSIHLRGLVDCRVLVGPSASAALIEDCRSCTITVAAHQIRLSRCHGIQLRAFVATGIVMEDSSAVAVCELDLWYAEMACHMKAAGLTGQSKHQNIRDLSCL